MTIQWYPGHMAKAKREVQEKLKIIDVVIEIVDARIPLSSRNPMIDDLTSHKPRLILLNKADLADSQLTKQWVQYFEKKNFAVLTVDAQLGKGIKDIPMKVRELAKPLLDKFRAKGMNPRALRALILGIPNVGKSTVINRLANKKITKIGDRPGVTKSQQWIKVGKEMELLDTPGILWPKFEDQDVGFRLALTGAIKEEIFDFQETIVFLLNELKTSYPERLKERYHLETLAEDITELLDDIGTRRGCLVAGGLVDYDRTAEMIFRDFRQGKLGHISLERP
ncbi:ribosome biogenesis GTPase YlqF [Salipaludibacillus agaradhaerens]|uniref:Ribosome biogenesis GTPase A n=1 Tax=Salipaludibacillus agaradhaerens TaxID=76935 RepID=A0A9Q4B0A4_SALAG|nr:ribosome biogenesis GTPase YlqF [Salipaludibacillus agaradhaerens]MCR6096022.1 ribosome biogenesis GTPase YlqF [Salipaludibacillus agaradhaerens]MCR6114419.1 ribosome biogenesis GTPase YlqF [Salipaludibacillus agaradhaerens]